MQLLSGFSPSTVTLLAALAISPMAALANDDNTAFNGTWIINEELSDDTDKQIEIAIPVNVPSHCPDIGA